METNAKIVRVNGRMRVGHLATRFDAERSRSLRHHFQEEESTVLDNESLTHLFDGKQIVQSKDKSQQIAVWRLLYWIQHLDQ